jgi:hypothetical protein
LDDEFHLGELFGQLLVDLGGIGGVLNVLQQVLGGPHNIGRLPRPATAEEERHGLGVGGVGVIANRTDDAK